MDLFSKWDAFATALPRKTGRSAAPGDQSSAPANLTVDRLTGIFKTLSDSILLATDLVLFPLMLSAPRMPPPAAAHSPSECSASVL